MKLRTILTAGAFIVLQLGATEAHDFWGMANPDVNDPELPTYEDLAQDANSFPEESNARYVLERALLWHPGSTLRMCFINGSNNEWNRVVNAIQEMRLAENEVNLSIVLTGNCTADSAHEIRISFEHGCCAAYVGRTSHHPKLRGKPTVFFRSQLPKYVIQHEILHTLGAHHDHQNPEGADCFSRLRDVDAYAERNGWDIEKVKNNLQQFARNQRRFAWSEERDTKSLTHYQISANDLIGGVNDPCYTRGNSTMSSGDYEGLRYAYPVGVGVAESAARAESGLEELDKVSISPTVKAFLEETMAQ